jgi:hypothetical protein
MNELKDMRAGLTGRPPEELHQARAMLLAEIHGEGRGDTTRRRTTRAAKAAKAAKAARTRRHTPRWLGPVIIGTAAAATAVLTVTLLPGTPARHPSAGPSHGQSSNPGHNQSQSQNQNPSGTPALTAAYILDHAASAAASAPLPVPRPDQYVYVSSVNTYVSTEVGKSGTRSWLYRTGRQIWLSVDGLRTGLLREVQYPNVKLPWGPVPPPITGDPVSWSALNGMSCPGKPPARFTYAFLATLPTGPAQLRTWIYTHKNGQNPADAQAWNDIGDMFREMLVPPKLAAALFKVAETIPGTTVLRNVPNAVGQRGIAVSRAGAALIFDPKTYQFIGEGAVLIKDTPGMGPAGTVVASTAQLQVKVVSKLPDVPPSKVMKDSSNPGC